MCVCGGGGGRQALASQLSRSGHAEEHVTSLSQVGLANEFFGGPRSITSISQHTQQNPLRQHSLSRHLSCNQRADFTPFLLSACTASVSLD